MRRVLVDGLGVGDVGQTVLRDRRVLAREGMVVIIYLIDGREKKLIKKPGVVSRGFVYIKQNKQLLESLRKFAADIYQKNWSANVNLRDIRQIIQGEIEKLIYQKTGREPMVLPLLIEV